MNKIPPLDWERLRRDLAERYPDGKYPPNVIEANAFMLGVTPGHLARRLAQPDKAARRRQPLNDEQLSYLAKYRKAKLARRMLVADGLYGESYSTFLRQATLTSKALRAGILEGEDALRDHFVFRAYEASEVNEVWQQDSAWSKVQVVKDRSIVEPVIELVVDSKSRFDVGIAFGINDPDDHLASMALAEAVHGQLTPEHQPARSRRLRHDQALYYVKSHRFNTALGLAGIQADAVMGYSGYLKGIVERNIKTMRVECLDLLPGSQRVAQVLGKEHEADPRDRRHLLDWDEFVERVLAWVHHYNFERPHSALDGRTPAEVYLEGAKPAHDLSEEHMRSMLRHPGNTRRISKNGVRFRDVDYIHPQLTGMVGEEVEIGYRDSDPTRLDIFVAGMWLCTARPPTHWSKDEKAFYDERNRLFKRARQIRARASKLRTVGVPEREIREEDEDDAFLDLELADEADLDEEAAS